MPDNTVSPELLEPALPGAWIAEHRRIWQMNFLNAYELARFCDDRGLADFGEKGIIQLWQLGLLKADLVQSNEAHSYHGLVDRGINRNGVYIYSDERLPQQRSEGWADAAKTPTPLGDDIELLFHPFRYYVLYHLNRVLGINIHKMQVFNQASMHQLLDISLSHFNHWSSSEQFIARFQLWNDIVSLAVVTEPCIHERIFHFVRYDPSELKDYQAGEEEIEQHINDYWHTNVEKLYRQIGTDRLEQIRQDLCFDTQVLDPNRWIHTLLCLGESKLRLELEGHLGGALLLRTMAEMLRRATEKIFDAELREEDELGFGWVPKNAKETIYGSNRILDDHQAAGAFTRRHGLNYKPRVHLYGEGDTEYGALTSFFTSIGVSISINNLHGLIKQSNSMVTFFRDELRSDIREQRYSIVIIDGDARDRENVRILQSAARNNQTSQNDGIFGRFFLSKPDFEFENFEVKELEEIFWNWVGGEKPSQVDRELLHNHVKATTNSTEFFNGAKRAALTLPQIYGCDKCEAWGAELMKYAWEHQLKENRQRKIIEAVKLALYWERTINLERYESAIKGNMVDPQTGELVERQSSTSHGVG